MRPSTGALATQVDQPWLLEVDALVVSNNEALRDRTGLTGEIFAAGGPAFVADANSLASVRTGDARLSSVDSAQLPGSGIAARRVVHAVGPKYQVQYAHAAASALHSAYRNTLQLCRAHGLRTLAFVPLHDAERKGYPTADAAHVALRTIRRFLEKHVSAVDVLLLLLVNTPTSRSTTALRLCTSRAPPQSWYAPPRGCGFELGDENGEVIPAERKIRIIHACRPSRQGRARSGSPCRCRQRARGPR